MLIYLLRHGLTEYNAQKRYQGQRDENFCPAGRTFNGIDKRYPAPFRH